MIPYIDVQKLFDYNVSAPTEINISVVPAVPFYSQLKDINDTKWQKSACGIASVAMIIEYYDTGTVSINKLLAEGISSGAYLKSAGWKHKELAQLADKYGFTGKNYDLSKSDKNMAFAELKKYLKDGPVIISVFYKFDPKSTIPHLVVINGIEGDTIYYNDPAADSGGKTISTADFLKGWKKRFIVVRPA